MLNSDTTRVTRGLTRRLFFFNDTAPTEIYALSLHDALPIYWLRSAQVTARHYARAGEDAAERAAEALERALLQRSEEHTSELQSRQYLVCRLLLEKKPIPHPMSAPLHNLHVTITHALLGMHL